MGVGEEGSCGGLEGVWGGGVGGSWRELGGVGGSWGGLESLRERPDFWTLTVWFKSWFFSELDHQLKLFTFCGVVVTATKQPGKGGEGSWTFAIYKNVSDCGQPAQEVFHLVRNNILPF